MALNSLWSFNADEEDYETLKRRRAIAEAIAQQRPRDGGHPITTGLTQLGEGVGSLIGQMRLAQMERSQKARDAARRGGGPPEPNYSEGRPSTVAPVAPRPQAAPSAQPAPVPVTPAVPRPPTQINPVQNQQTSQAVPSDADLGIRAREDEATFGPMDAAAIESTPNFADRYSAVYDPTSAPVPPDPAFAERFGATTDRPLAAMPTAPAFAQPDVPAAALAAVDPRAPTPGPNWPPAPPAEPVRDINAFAPATPIERAAAPADDPWPRFSAGLKGIESGGARDPYRLVGAATRGDRPYGAYQIMGKNIGPWSKAALGREASKDEFLANDKMQDEIARHRFLNYATKYGPEGAAQAWFAGEKGMKNLGATDVHGRLTVASYGKDFMRRIGQDSGTAVAGGATPYRNVAVRPEVDPRAEIAEIAALNPQTLADPGAPNLQARQPDAPPDAEGGTRQMIAEALLGQQRRQGVQTASMGDPARMGISMPRAEPMGNLPLMQSRNQPVPPRPPPGSPGIPDPNNPGSFISPDMFNANVSGSPDMSGTDVPSMEGSAPAVTPEMLDPFAFPFNPSPAPPAAGGDPNAGAPIPAAPATPAAVPAPPEQPAPVRMAQAQLAPGIRPDATGSPFPPPPPPPAATSQGIQPTDTSQGIQRAPEPLPSQEPIPPPIRGDVPKPGKPPPPEPRPLARSQYEEYWTETYNDPKSSDGLRREAGARVTAAQNARLKEDERRWSNYGHLRTKWEQDEKASDEYWNRGGREKAQQEDLQRRIAIQKGGPEALTADLERQIKEIDLRLKQEGEPFAREQLRIERDQKQATLDETRQRVEAGKKPQHLTFGKTLLEWNKDTKSWRDVTPGTQYGNIDVSEAQAKKLQFFERSYVARRQGGDYTAMAGLMDSGAGKIPIAGNYWTSPQFQIQNNAADAWIENVLRDVSGAVIRVEEYPQQKKIYFPQPGDKPELIQAKAARRESVERSFYDGLGTARPIADKFMADEKEKENKAMLDWARSTPNHPDAKEILRRMGVQ